MKTKRVLIIIITIIAIVGVSYAGTLNIEPASDEQKGLIQSALGSQYPISKIAVIKSANHRMAYYVGAVFFAQGVGNVTGIWLVGGSKDSPKVVYSVDGYAHQFSGMRKASETKAAAYIWDPEAKALEKYFNK